MRITVLAAAVAVATLGLATAARAGEGMWVPQQLPEISKALKKAGLKLDAKQLANLTGDPLGAVVSIVVLKERYNLRTLLASLGIFLAALALCRRAERQMRG